MRLSVLFSTFVFCATVKSQQSTLLEDYLRNYPQCAAQCVLPVIQDVGFGNHNITDTSTKLCPDISSTRRIYFCIQTNCSYADEVASWPFQEALCPGHQVPSRAGYIRNLTLTMALLTAVFVLLRYYSRICIVKKFRWDDSIMAIAFILFISMAVVIVWASTVGLGLHEWDADPRNVIVAAKVLYVFETLYIIIQGLIKVSILLFYIRVFPDPWIKALTWGFIAFQIFHGVGFLLATMFQCTPVSLVWDYRLEGHCIRFDTLTFPIAVFSIVENISILSLPVPCLWQLNIGRGKKMCLLGMFGMGILACVISILRVKPMLEYVETLDQMWDSIPLIAWSEAELAVATICVCLPSFKAILDHHVPRYFGSQPGSGCVTGTLTTRPTVGNQMGNSNRGQTWFSRQLKTGRLGKPFGEGSGLGFAGIVEGHGLGDKHLKKRSENGRGLKQGAVRSNKDELPGVVTGHGQAPIRIRQDLRTGENKMRKDRDLWMDEVKKTRHLSEIKVSSDSYPMASRADPNAQSMAAIQEAPVPDQYTTELSMGHMVWNPSTRDREVPISLDEGGYGRWGQAEEDGKGYQASVGSVRSNSAILGGRSGYAKPWVIGSFRMSGFRISVFEGRLPSRGRVSAERAGEAV